MTIHQEIVFNCNPQSIFEVLTNAEKFSKLTGAPAEINLKVGGKFSCFGGIISGLTIETVPNKMLVQAWRVGNWPAGIYSIVRFELEK